MKKCCLLLILSVLCCCYCYAGPTFTVNDKYAFVGEKICNLNGQLQFGVTEFRGNLNVKDIKGVGMKFNQSKTYSIVPGKWYDENFEETAVFRKDETTYFVSNESFFETEGNYTILLANKNISEKPAGQIEYLTGKNSLEDGSGLDFKVYCPKMKYICKPINVKVIFCNTTLHGFVAIFKGLGGANLDLNEDIEYFLGYSSEPNYEFHEPVSANAKVSALSKDQYMLEVPLEDLKHTVSGVYVRIKRCLPKLYRTSTYKSCFTTKAVVQKIVERNLTLELQRQQEFFLNKTRKAMNQTQEPNAKQPVTQEPESVQPGNNVQKENESLQKQNLSEKPTTQGLSFLRRLLRFLKSLL